MRNQIKLDSNDVVLTVIESVYDKANNRVRCYYPSNKKTLVSIYDKRNLLVTLKAYHGKVLPADEQVISLQLN